MATRGGLVSVGVACVVAAVLTGCGGTGPAPPRPSLLETWAPVFFQDTDARLPQADFITAVDFDGNWVGNDNWQSFEAPGVDLRAFVYAAHVESERHHFLTYVLFHPRDWAYVCEPAGSSGTPCHENDLEGALVVVEKDGSEEGRFVLLVTVAHSNLNLYDVGGALRLRPLQSTVPLLHPHPATFEEGTHPRLFSQALGHGLYALDPYEGAAYRFPGNDGVVYRLGEAAEPPEHGDDRDVRYALVPLETTLWARRGDIGPGRLWDGELTFEGERLGRAMDGDDWRADAANPPWSWHDELGERGEFLLRPGRMLDRWLEGAGGFDTPAVSHPFLPGP